MGKKKSSYYVKNKELLNEIIEYKKEYNKYINDLKLSKKNGTKTPNWPGINDKLGKMIFNIATGLAKKGQFTGYTYKDEFISDAVLANAKYIKNFNPEKSTNAFAYVTQICYNAFINRINKEKKHSNIKDTCYKNQEIIKDSNFSDQAVDYTKLKTDK